MEPSYLNFGGRNFPIEQINLVRRLAIGDKIATEANRGNWRGSDFEGLTCLCGQGLATFESDGREGKYEHHIFQATDELFALRDKHQANVFALRDKHQANVFTFDALAKKMGRDISPATVRRLSRKRRLAPCSTRVFPSIRDVSHRSLVEAQGPLSTTNVPVEPGDEVQFSSRGLTDFYVAEFTRINHLK